jgi:hypothetical protein
MRGGGEDKMKKEDDPLCGFIKNASSGEDVTGNADERDLDDGLGR